MWEKWGQPDLPHFLFASDRQEVCGVRRKPAADLKNRPTLISLRNDRSQTRFRYWQTGPAPVRNVPLSENSPPAAVDAVRKNHGKYASSCKW
jgi:hypothetical protein